MLVGAQARRKFFRIADHFNPAEGSPANVGGGRGGMLPNFSYDRSKQAALAILNMFDDGVAHLIEGPDIDRPRNALTLTQEVHGWFGNFDIFFEAVPESDPHTYRIGTFLHPWLTGDIVPVKRTLYLTESRSIEPASARLLAIHCAIAHILHLSAAGDYIDEILKDMELEGIQGGVQADGSTDLGRLVHLGLWLDGVMGA